MGSLSRSTFVCLLALAFAAGGCAKRIPQVELDAAEQAIADLEATKDCAPETYLAAKTTMDRARALLKEERHEEAKTALIAAKKLAEKAQRECDEKRERDKLEAERRRQAEQQAQQAARQAETPTLDPHKTVPEQMRTVYFGFNNSDLTDEARTTLGENAEYIRHHSAVRVQLEGHCDERGSTEYNLALGERRALSVRQYLVKLGVHPDRLEIISYGEERPIDLGQTEQAHGRNRRAEFRELK